MKKQSGFALVQAALIFVVLAVVGGTGWYVVNSNKKTSDSLDNAEQSNNITPQSNPTVTEDVEKTSYVSKYGNFSLKYPKNWTLVGFKGAELQLVTGKLNGDETQIRLTSNREESKNNFGMDITMYGASTANQYESVENGTLSSLSNFQLWTRKKVIKDNEGQNVEAPCPYISIVSNNKFEYKMPHGKFMSLFGSYCWGEGIETSYSYQQQIDSKELKEAIEVIKSIKFN